MVGNGGEKEDGGEREDRGGRNVSKESQIFKKDLGILRYAKSQIHPIKSHTEYVFF